MRATYRTARGRHRCGTCLGPIAPGEQYIEYTTYPSDDWSPFDQPVRDRECARCAMARKQRIEAGP